MTERAPTERQERILEVIREFTAAHGYPPSVREIGERVGLSSSSTVQSHLKSLEKRGLIHRDPTKPRALTARPAASGAPPAERAPEAAVLPILGKVAAGIPITATENYDGELVVPLEYARKAGSFVLRVQGESMIDAAILDGDFVVVSPQSDAANGEIVVAMIAGEATVKRFYREHGRIRLQPENRTMEPMYADSNDEVTVLGRVGAIFRKL
jgi:repressor LexA